VRLLKGARVAVFRIDDECERPNAKSIRTHGGLDNERPAKAAAAIVQMHRESAHDRYRRIARVKAADHPGDPRNLRRRTRASPPGP
jgi:hypothetical protein